MVRQGFVEVTTPHLVTAGAFENTIDTLKVSHSAGSGELHSSPEMEMKGLLALTKLNIYQICQCFRDDPPSPIHSREFTMLEFYRVSENYRAIMRDMKNLFNVLSGTSLTFEEITVRELMLSATGIDLLLHPTVEALKGTAELKGLLKPATTDSWEDVFFRLMIDFAEPQLSHSRPVIVHDYPPQVAALAKLSPDRSVAERFEIYWKGVEICNGCTELDELSELKARVNSEADARRRESKQPHPKPTSLLRTFEKGYPSSAGVAVGLNRLFKCLFGTDSPTLGIGQ